MPPVVHMSTDDGLPGFYITPGTYEVSADFDNETRFAQLEIAEDGEYALAFKQSMLNCKKRQQGYNLAKENLELFMKKRKEYFYL